MAIFKLLSSVSSAIMFFVGKALYPVLQIFLYRISGVYEHRRLIAAGKVDDLNVEILNIHSKCPGQAMIITLPWLYLCWHERFVTTSYLLKPNITLLRVDKDKVYFLEHDVSQNVYDCRKYPFFFLAQYDLCKKLIVVPLDEFVKLGEKIGEPKCSVTWIFHTTRCGSTALVQALNAVEGMTVISESQHMVMYLADYGYKFGSFDGLINTENFRVLAMACIKFIFKDFSKQEKVALKTAGIMEYKYLFPLVTVEYPKHKVISMYRDGKGTTSSNYAHAGIFDALFAFLEHYPFKWVLRGKLDFLRFFLSNGMLRDVRSSTERSLYYLLFCQWLSNIVDFRKNSKPAGNLMTLLYDDLLASKEQTITKVFEHLHIDQHFLSAALEALEEDSQKDTPLAKGKGKMKWKPNEDIILKCEQLLRDNGLPSYHTKFRFTANLDVEILAH